MAGSKHVKFILLCVVSVLFVKHQTEANLMNLNMGSQCDSGKCEDGDNIEHSKRKYYVKGVLLLFIFNFYNIYYFKIGCCLEKI